jgi:hypothetical protein
MRYADVVRCNGSVCRARPSGNPCHAWAPGSSGIYRGRSESTSGSETAPPALIAAWNARPGVVPACVGPPEGGRSEPDSVSSRASHVREDPIS